MTAQPPSISTTATAPGTGTLVDGTLADLLQAVRACRVCAAHLPHGPRPVLQAGAGARILIVGQAPGARVHANGVPWPTPAATACAPGWASTRRPSTTPSGLR
jgi:hypothetical protein